jgi:nucleoid DNA-binding protein/cell division septation protein DedD
MTITHYIKDALIENKKVVVPNLGTFTAQYEPARIKNNGSILLPPNAKVTFSHSVYSSDFDALGDYIQAKEKRNRMEIEEEIMLFSTEIKGQVGSYGKYTLTDFGQFRLGNDGKFEFIQSDEVVLLNESYGLPKVTAMPLIPVSDEADSVNSAKIHTPIVPEKDHSVLLWFVIIPLVLLGVFIAYIFVNKEASEKVAAIFSDQPAEPTTVTDTTATANTDSLDALALLPPPSTSKDKEIIDKASKEKQESTKQNNTPTKTTEKTVTAQTNTNDVVSSNKGRFYIIAGSFNTVANAQKAVNIARTKGYKEAKIVEKDGKIRLSLGDFSSKQEADNVLSDYRRNYENAWILIY